MTNDLERQPQIVVIDGGYREPSYVHQTTTVHEHRAPTHASVALLKEMEKAARDKIEHALSVGGNGFECVVHMANSLIDDSILAVAIFKLNGKPLRAEFRLRRYELKLKDQPMAKIVQGLVDATAAEIAREILMPALAQVEWPRF